MSLVKESAKERKTEIVQRNGVKMEERREGIGNSAEGRNIIAFKAKRERNRSSSKGIRIRRRRKRGERKSEFVHFNISLLIYSAAKGSYNGSKL